jgi:HK97 family phage major capsid protein
LLAGVKGELMKPKHLKVTEALKKWLAENCEVKDADTLDAMAWANLTKECFEDGRLPVATLLQLSEEIEPTPADDPPNPKEDPMSTKNPTPARLFSANHIRVKGPNERYSNERRPMKHAKSGEAVFNPHTGGDAEAPSELELAKAGTWLRWLAIKQGIPGVRSFDEHETTLWRHCASDEWLEFSDKDNEVRSVKAPLLSDTVSGGQYANPLWWDNAVITFPLLTGELFPFVDLVDMPRSNVVNTASVGNPTVTWGQTDGSSLTPFDATALVAPVNSTVVNVMVGVLVSRDLLSDAAANLGGILVNNVGQRMQHELDRVIAVGNGSTEPQGITGTSGLSLVPSDLSTGGIPTVGDYEALMFGIKKQYRNKALNPCYIANDISYRRARGIPVGPGDERRVFGMDHSSYELLEHPYRIAQDADNNHIIFGALKKYRLYRRLGFETRWTIEGQTLGLANEALLIVRGRFAGRVVDVNAFAVTTDAAN